MKFFSPFGGESIDIEVRIREPISRKSLDDVVASLNQAGWTDGLISSSGMVNELIIGFSNKKIGPEET